jgi:Cu2+-exporting ATPase
MQHNHKIKNSSDNAHQINDIKNNNMNHLSMEHSNHNPNDDTIKGKMDSKQHGYGGYQDQISHHKMMIEDYKKRFIFSLIFTIPVLVLSPLIQSFFGVTLVFFGSMYVLLTLASLIFFYGGWPFLKGIFIEVKNKSLGMMTLIAVAISVAYFYSAAVVFGFRGEVFFWELATLIDIMLLGHWLEMRSILGASNALEKLSQLMPDNAHVVKGKNIVDIKISELTIDDRVLIKPGEKIPADGIIVKGQTYVNESMLTGESKPVEKKEEGTVIGGSINGDGSIEILVKNTDDESYLSKVISLVRETQESKSKTQLLADRAAFVLTVVSLSVGFTTLGVWIYLGQGFEFSIERMATVMVITCPHALGLAIPLVVAISTTLSAKNGLLIRNRNAFENSRKISTVVFDKTGTLTEGKFGVSSIRLFDKKYTENKLLQLAASLEKNSGHPIATGIISKAKELEIEFEEVYGFQVIKGKGVEGIIENQPVKVVSPSYILEKKMQISEGMLDQESATTVFVVVDDKVAGSISLSDTIREESHVAVQELQKAGIKCWMLTGDNKKIAESVSKKLGLDGFFAEVLAHEKQEKIKELQSKGEFVAMTGDGVNDAPALAQAEVGIAIGSGTDVAAETADIILVNSNPADVTSLILFGKATYRKMIQNLFWATGYNVIAIPLAAGVLYSQGILISPALGAIFMSVSTMIVAINSRYLRIKREE